MMNQFLKISKNFRFSLLAIIILISFSLMLNASLQESATMDELAHIPAGYSYVKYLDYRLNPEHPPLLKAISAIPLLFQKINFPIESQNWQNDVNGQWAVGSQFLYESENNADKIIQWSRLGPMILTLILIIFIYIWSSELIGAWWAFLPTFLFAFSPNVLAHGHYVTTDIAATLGIFSSLYFFTKFLSEPSKKHLIFAGLAFGIAQLLKFSAILLIPFFIFLITIFYIRKTLNDWPDAEPSKRLKRFSIRAYHYIKSVFIIFLIGYAVVYAVYFIFTINYPIEKQKAGTEFILSSFGNRFLAETDIQMSGNKILRPIGEYLLGVLMVIQRSSGGNTGYFLGEVSSGGWWYYFPIVFILKEPIPSLILILLAFLFSIKNILKILSTNWRIKFKIFNDYLGLHFAEFSMISFIIFYWIYSMKSPLNIGIRHILPTLPLIYILTASGIKKWFLSFTTNYNNFFSAIFAFAFNFTKTILKSAALTIILLWYILETLINSPYYLSYFNEFGGGVWNGYKYVVDSNYDWGQDLKRLKKFVEKNDIEKISVDYFGGGNPKYYLGDKAQHWRSSMGNPKDDNIEWLAVSINTLQNSPDDEYLWLKNIKNIYQPDYLAGTSIFIYKF
ncbi:glycosyltransferase family 39 protein [Candidatus Wolfebacteria bacterium]|nr:glycosyltransferase family 39 protein [Candidatus Wolfebacteria bacterium]